MKYPFPCRLNLAGKNQVAKEIVDAIKNCNSPIAKEFEAIEVKNLTEAQRVALVENHLASPEFISDANGRVLVLSKDRTISIMINEEDHIKIQCMTSGLNLEEVLENVVSIDEKIEENIKYAFDELKDVEQKYDYNKLPKGN